MLNIADSSYIEGERLRWWQERGWRVNHTVASFQSGPFPLGARPFLRESGIGKHLLPSPSMSTPDTARRSWRFAFTGVLVLAMVSATQMPMGLGILASFMRSDLEVSRTQIGSLITVTIVLGALLSPAAGRVADRLGGRRAIGVLFVAAGIGYLGLAVLPGYGLLFAAAAVAGIAQSGGNPVTNKLIARHSPAGTRGVITGIKQSGVQAGVFVSGLVLPAIAGLWGWRWAFGVVVLVPAAGLVGTALVLPQDRPGRTAALRSRTTEDRLPLAIWFLTVYGTLMGLGAAYTFLVPLFVEETLGMSEQVGGLVAGLVGFTSLFARIGWARHADRAGRHAVVLALLAMGSVVAAGVFLASQYTFAWLVWPAAVLTGLSSSSWNSVGMLAVIGHAGHDRSGHASGVVMLGFLTGLAIGPTLFAGMVDLSGSYTPVWVTSMAVLSLAMLVSLWWVRSPRREPLV